MKRYSSIVRIVSTCYHNNVCPRGTPYKENRLYSHECDGLYYLTTFPKAGDLSSAVRWAVAFKYVYSSLLGSVRIEFARIYPIIRYTSSRGHLLAPVGCELYENRSSVVCVEKVGLTPREMMQNVKQNLESTVKPVLQADQVKMFTSNPRPFISNSLPKTQTVRPEQGASVWNCWASYSGRIRRL